MGLDIPSWVPVPKGIGLNDLLEWERQVYTIEEWQEVMTIAKDYSTDISLLVNGRLYSVPAIVFGFVDYDGSYGEKMHLAALYRYGQFLRGDRKDQSFAVFTFASQMLAMLMEKQVKFEWLQAKLIQKNPKRVLQVWHLKEPLVLDTLSSLTVPTYEIVYRNASQLIDNMPDG